jgi:hypothetical protein
MGFVGGIDKCHRCHGDWQEDTTRTPTIRWKCQACNMMIDELYLTLRSPLGDPDRHLGWFPYEHICMYASIIDRVQGTETRLPWLPFDITSEKLKLYLLFS